MLSLVPSPRVRLAEPPVRRSPGAPAAWAQRALCGGDGMCQAARARLRARLRSALLRGRSRPSAARRQPPNSPPLALRWPRWPTVLCGASAGGRSARSLTHLSRLCARLPHAPTRHAPSPLSRGCRQPRDGALVQGQAVAAEDSSQRNSRRLMERGPLRQYCFPRAPGSPSC